MARWPQYKHEAHASEYAFGTDKLTNSRFVLARTLNSADGMLKAMVLMTSAT